MKSGDFNLISNITHRPFFHEKVFESWREIKIASNHSEFYLGSNLIPRVSQRVISHVDICSSKLCTLEFYMKICFDCKNKLYVSENFEFRQNEFRKYDFWKNSFQLKWSQLSIYFNKKNTEMIEFWPRLLACQGKTPWEKRFLFLQLSRQDQRWSQDVENIENVTTKSL